MLLLPSRGFQTERAVEILLWSHGFWVFILQGENKHYIVHQYNDQWGLKAVKDTDKGGESAQLAQTTVTCVPG